MLGSHGPASGQAEAYAICLARRATSDGQRAAGTPAARLTSWTSGLWLTQSWATCCQSERDSGAAQAGFSLSLHEPQYHGCRFSKRLQSFTDVFSFEEGGKGGHIIRLNSRLDTPDKRTEAVAGDRRFSCASRPPTAGA